eukprot:366426-Chlamydomonas_euryale.AAC.14
MTCPASRISTLGRPVDHSLPVPALRPYCSALSCHACGSLQLKWVSATASSKLACHTLPPPTHVPARTTPAIRHGDRSRLGAASERGALTGSWLRL